MIRIGSLDPADAAITLFQAESSVSYASGHVLFARDETLMAQPFDPDTRQLTGDAFPLAEHVAREGSRYVGASVSENGTLVYASGGSQATYAVDMVRSRGPRPRHAGRSGSVHQPRAFTRRTPRGGRAGNRESGKPRHLDHRYRP